MAAGITANEGGELELEPGSDALVLKLKGAWRLSGGITSADSLFQRPELASIPHRIRIDSSALTGWDTALVCFLVELRKRCESLNIAIDAGELPEGARRLVDLALAFRDGEGKIDEAPGALGQLARVDGDVEALAALPQLDKEAHQSGVPSRER